MRRLTRIAALPIGASLAVVLALSAAAAAAPLLGNDAPPAFLPFSYPPDGTHMMGESSVPGRPAGTPGITAPLVPPADKAPPPAAQSRVEVLDDLFHRLSVASDGEEATGLAARIQRLWLDSGSDTVDLLMSRAAGAVEKGDNDLAIQLLDKIVVLDPEWAEGWNRRAKLRFTKDDDDAAMADIGHVLALEPRHFGAMTGMAVIMQRHGFKKEALMLLRKAAGIYPHNDDLTKMIDTLTPEVEGRDL